MNLVRLHRFPAYATPLDKTLWWALRALCVAVLVFLLLPVGLLAALTYWRAGNLDVRASLLVALGLLFGAWAGARLAQGVPAPTLQRLFAVFLIIVAVRMFVKA